MVFGIVGVQAGEPPDDDEAIALELAELAELDADDDALDSAELVAVADAVSELDSLALVVVFEANWPPLPESSSFTDETAEHAVAIVQTNKNNVRIAQENPN